MSKIRVKEFENSKQLNFFLKEVPLSHQDEVKITPLFHMNNAASDVLYVVRYKAWE